MPEYQFTLSEQQAKAYCIALEIFARLHLFQFDVIPEQFRHGDMKPVRRQGDPEITPANRMLLVEQLEALAAQMKRAVGLSPSSSLGVASDAVAEVGKHAWDGYQALRRALAFQRQPEGGFTVEFDTPLRTANEPVPVIRVVGPMEARPPVIREIDRARSESSGSASLTPAGLTELLSYVEKLEALVASHMASQPHGE